MANWTSQGCLTIEGISGWCRENSQEFPRPTNTVKVEELRDVQLKGSEFYQRAQSEQTASCVNGGLDRSSEVAGAETDAQEQMGQATCQWGTLKTNENMKITCSFSKAGT